MIEQAVILCAGKGSRLGELTRHTPKAMLPVPAGRVGGRMVERPFLELTILKLRRAGIREVVLVVGHLSHAIEDGFRDRRWARCVLQTQPSGTADALARTMPLLAPQFLLTYGDVWVAGENYHRIIAAAVADSGNWMAINDHPKPTGAVYLDPGAGRVRRMAEKPGPASGTHWNAPGLFALTRPVAQWAAQVGPSVRGERELADAFNLAIAAGNVIRPLPLLGRHVDIGTPEGYRQIRLVAAESV